MRSDRNLSSYKVNKSEDVISDFNLDWRNIRDQTYIFGYFETAVRAFNIVYLDTIFSLRTLY